MELYMGRLGAGHTRARQTVQSSNRRRTFVEAVGFTCWQRIKERVQYGRLRQRVNTRHGGLLSRRLSRNMVRVQPRYPVARQTQVLHPKPRPRTWSGISNLSTSSQRFRVRLRHGVSASLRARATYAGDKR